MNSINRTIRNSWFFFPSCDHLLAVSICSSNRLTCLVLKAKYCSNSSDGDSSSSKNSGKKKGKSGFVRDLDYYEILGVDKRAQAKEIKDAYIKLSKVYHPDRNKSPEALERFQEVSIAYETIGSYDSRRNYDRKQFGAQIQTQMRKAASRSEPSPFESSGFRRRKDSDEELWRSEGSRYEDYTQGLYKDKMGREKVFRTSPSAEESVTKKSERVTYFDPKISRVEQSNYPQSRHLESKANFLRRRLVKGLSNESSDPVSDAVTESLMLPFLLVFLSFFLLYAVTEIVNYNKLQEGTLGDKLNQKKYSHPNYLANEPIKEPKFINTKEYNEYVRMKKD